MSRSYTGSSSKTAWKQAFYWCNMGTEWSRKIHPGLPGTPSLNMQMSKMGKDCLGKQKNTRRRYNSQAGMVGTLIILQG